MTPDRCKRITMSSILICAMLPCAFFSLRPGPHHVSFGLALDVLMLISFWVSYRHNIQHRRQPDTLIHLFPAPPETTEERF